MTSKSLQVIPPRVTALLALVLIFLAGGIRLGEWTHCLEVDGRVHVETGGDDCASDGSDHVGHDRLDAPFTSSQLPAAADCDGCLDITSRSLGLRFRSESLDSSPNQVFPLHVGTFQVAAPVSPILPAIGDLDWACASLTHRATDSVVLTC